MINETENKLLVTNVEKTIRVYYFLLNAKITVKKKKIVISKALLVNSFLSMRERNTLVRITAMLYYLTKHFPKWKESVQVHFGTDVVFLLKEVIQVFKALEQENYERVQKSHSLAKAIISAIALTEMLLELNKPHLERNRRVYAIRLANWRLVHLKMENDEYIEVCRKVIKDFEENESIEIL